MFITTQEYSIYGLIDPRDNSTRYVGVSKEPNVRMKAHTRDRGGSKGKWLNELQKLGLMPRVEVLETITASQDAEVIAAKREQYWIKKLIADGKPLLNVAGVTQPYVAPRLNKQSTERGKGEARLKAIRESIGLSQEGVAQRSGGLSARTVRNAETGKKVTFDTGIKILNAINVALSEAGKEKITLDDLRLTFQ